MATFERYAVRDSSFVGSAAMQMNEIVRRIQQVRRLPVKVGAAIARRAKQSDAGAPRPAATKPSEVAGDPERRARRFGAGF